MNDPLANVMSHIKNSERLGRKYCYCSPVSNLIRNTLKIMNEKGYIGEVEEVEDGRGGIFKVNLLGRINNCGVVKPRFTVQMDDYKKNEKRYLIANDFGFLVVSTSNGLMTHEESKEKNIGGRLIAYCY